MVVRKLMIKPWST